jgi:hypothetical protein
MDRSFKGPGTLGIGFKNLNFTYFLQTGSRMGRQETKFQFIDIFEYQIQFRTCKLDQQQSLTQ